MIWAKKPGPAHKTGGVEKNHQQMKLRETGSDGRGVPWVVGGLTVAQSHFPQKSILVYLLCEEQTEKWWY